MNTPNSTAFLARKARHNETGKIVTFHEGHNTNNSATIVWVKVEGEKSRRVTGKNIAAVYADIDAAIASGEATDLLAIERNRQDNIAVMASEPDNGDRFW